MKESYNGTVLPSPILTKEQFVREYQKGTFGNRSPTWDSMDAMQEDFDNSYPLLNNPNQLWHIRNRVAGGPTYYDIPGEILADKWEEVRGEQYYISAMAPTPLTTFQGEARVSEDHLDLFYSTIPKPMRASLLERGKQVYSIIARELIRYYMDSSSYDWFNELLGLYPGHVIEFSCYSTFFGTIPRRNTIIWEVRGGY